MSTVTLDVDFVVRQCSKCGITYCLPSNFSRARADDHKSWYCPNGHGQHIPALSDAEKLRKQLEEERRRHSQTQIELMAAENQVAAISKEKARLQKRIKNGVCPCCHRSFVQLSRHMASKHPGFEAS